MDFKEELHFKKVFNDLDVVIDYDLLDREIADEEGENVDVVDFIKRGIVDG